MESEEVDTTGIKFVGEYEEQNKWKQGIYIIYWK